MATGIEMRPVIATSGPAKLKLNIGSVPFVSQIPEFKNGLL